MNAERRAILARRSVVYDIGRSVVIAVDVKKRFLRFYSCHVLRFKRFFIFRTFLKIKNVENLLCMQANSEIQFFERNVS